MLTPECSHLSHCMLLDFTIKNNELAVWND
jgi:hypothetical protein